MTFSPGAGGQPLSAEQREKLVKQKEQYEKAAEKLEDQVECLLLRLKVQFETNSPSIMDFAY